MIDLARRSSHIETSMLVYDQDRFDYEYGLIPSSGISRRWATEEVHQGLRRGPVQRWGYHFEFMPKSGSTSAGAGARPRTVGPGSRTEEMAASVIRHMFKYLPISVEIMKQVEHTDETVKTEIALT